MPDLTRSRWDAAAPWWAAGLVLLATTGLATVWVDLGAFWRSYVLDMTGPAWNYILFRGRFTARSDNRWTRFFTPVRTLVVFLGVCLAIESAQFLGLYDATFDPWDLVAYVSILLPLFASDLWTLGEPRTEG